jgi:hypothetical protein
MIVDEEVEAGLSFAPVVKDARAFEREQEFQLREGRHKTAINRSYYAALSAVRSVLILGWPSFCLSLSCHF